MKIQWFVNLCVIEHSDVLLICRTARLELKVLLMWSTSAKKLDWVESLIHPESQICSRFFSLLHSLNFL